MRWLSLIFVCLVACAESTAEDSIGLLDAAVDPSTGDGGSDELDGAEEYDGAVEAGDAALVLDGASLDAALEDATSEDAAPDDAASEVEDAAEPVDSSMMSEPDTSVPEQPDSGMSEPPDAGAPDAGPMCDLTACTCFLALPCCTAANTCACYILPGFCNLPPIKVTTTP